MFKRPVGIPSLLLIRRGSIFSSSTSAAHDHVKSLPAFPRNRRLRSAEISARDRAKRAQGADARVQEVSVPEINVSEIRAQRGAR